MDNVEMWKKVPALLCAFEIAEFRAELFHARAFLFCLVDVTDRSDKVVLLTRCKLMTVVTI